MTPFLRKKQHLTSPRIEIEEAEELVVYQILLSCDNGNVTMNHSLTITICELLRPDSFCNLKLALPFHVVNIMTSDKKNAY